jgi:uncharacterized oligopeptide transporter (OPT) family protein
MTVLYTVVLLYCCCNVAAIAAVLVAPAAAATAGMCHSSSTPLNWVCCCESVVTCMLMQLCKHTDVRSSSTRCLRSRSAF